MEAWIALAKGPLFRISLAVCLIGLAYRLVLTVAQIRGAWQRAGDRDLPLSAVARATATWLVPVRLLRARPFYSAASVLFHAGILLVPLLHAPHAALWQPGSGLAWWPLLSPSAVRVLGLIAAVALAVLLLGRVVVAAARDLTRASDLLILIVLLALVLTGYATAHPAAAPADPRALLLVHMLLGNLALVLTPTTKIVHCILNPFTQLIGELGWRFPAATGRHVAVALGKEKEPV